MNSAPLVGKPNIWRAEAPAIAEETLMTQHKQMLGKLLSPSNNFECENIKKKRQGNIP
jgi:hypothetical protein